MTSSDETNVVTAQMARPMFHVPPVVARLYDPWQTEIYERLGLQTISLTFTLRLPAPPSSISTSCWHYPEAD